MYDAVLTAGTLNNIIYAKLDLRHFKAVNTTKGPWPLLDALFHIELDHIYVRKDKQLPASTSIHETHTLRQVIEVIRRIATDLIGHENLQGALQMWFTSGLSCSYLSFYLVSQSTKHASTHAHMQRQIRFCQHAILVYNQKASIYARMQPIYTNLVTHFVGPEEQFVAGAFDSLSAVELSNVIGITMGVNLPSTLVFDCPSVSALAGYVHHLMYPPLFDVAHTHIVNPIRSQPIGIDQKAIQVGFINNAPAAFYQHVN